MSFLEFCRKTNDKGAIHQWVAHRWKASTVQADDGSLSLEELQRPLVWAMAGFTEAFPVTGLTLTRGHRGPGAFCRLYTLSFCLVVRFYIWSWKSFRFGVLVAMQVPVQCKHFANTTQQCPDYWTDESGLAQAWSWRPLETTRSKLSWQW